jgi:hypothetical protein
MLVKMRLQKDGMDQRIISFSYELGEISKL